MLVCLPCDCTSGDLNKTSVRESTLACLEFTRWAFPFYTSQIHGNNISFFQKGLPTLIPRSHFHFLYFIYFQTALSVLSSRADASTYFQIETLRYSKISYL